MDEELDVNPEMVAVAAWKVKVLTDAGCDPDMAGLLAAGEVDHWKAVGMAEAGCSWHTIVKILA